MSMKSCVLNCPIDICSSTAALDLVKEAVNNNKNFQIVTINPEMMSNPDMTDIVNSAELVIPDGAGVELALKIFGHNTHRIAGIEFAYRMIEECAKSSQSIAFIGAKPSVAEQAVKNLKNKIKNLNVSFLIF